LPGQWWARREAPSSPPGPARGRRPPLRSTTIATRETGFSRDLPGNQYERERLYIRTSSPWLIDGRRAGRALLRIEGVEEIPGGQELGRVKSCCKTGYAERIFDLPLSRLITCGGRSGPCLACRRSARCWPEVLFLRP